MCLSGASEAWRASFEEAERCLKRSISINPSLALAYGYLAAVACWRSDSKAADRWLERMKLLSPTDPALSWFTVTSAMSGFGERDYAGALERVNETIAMDPRLPGAWRILAITLEQMGDHDGAVVAVQRLLALGPTSMEWVISNITPFADPVAWDEYLESLRHAGVPEK